MLAVFLVVLTSLGAVASLVALWANQQLLNSDRWAELSGRIIREPEVVDRISFRLSTAIVSGLDVEDRVATTLAGVEQLPPQAELLAGPVADAVQERLRTRIGGMLETPGARELWVDTSRAAHDAIIRVLRGETRPGVTVEGGTVTLDLIPLANRALAATQDLISDLLGRPVDLPSAEEIQATGAPQAAADLLETRLGVTLPEDFGQVKVFSSDRLAAAQDALRLLDLLIVVIIVVTAVLLVASLIVSVNRRRTLIQLAIGFLLGALLARLGVQAVEDAIVDLAGEGARGAITDVVRNVFVGLVDFTTILLIGGIVVALAAYLAGRPAWLVRLGERTRKGATSDGARRVGAWARAHSDGLRLAGIVVAVLALFLVDLSWASVIIVLVILGLYELGVSYLIGTPNQQFEQGENV